MPNRKEKMSNRTRNFLNIFSLIFGTSFLVLAPPMIPYTIKQYFLLSLPMGAIFLLSAVWVLYRTPNPYVNYLLQISGSCLGAFIAYRCISYPFTQIALYIGIFMIFGLIFVHTIPMWNFSAALFIHDELYAPKTWIGKIVFRAILYILAPLGVIGGVNLGTTMVRFDNPNFNAIIIFLMGILSFYLAYTIPFIHWSQTSTKDYHHPLQDIMQRK